MKIALCTEILYPMYGVERRVYEMAKRLPTHGFDVTVYTSTPQKQLPDIKIKQLSNPTIVMPPKRNLALCSKFLTNLCLKASRSDCDIIDANGHLVLIPCAMASKISGKPSIATIHDLYTNQWKQLYKGKEAFFGDIFEKLSCKMPFDKILTVNSSLKNQLHQRFSINEQNIGVIANGVDIAYIDSIKAGPRKRRILFVGRLAPQKNVGMLIDAFSLLPKDLKTRYEIRIIGVGEEMNALKDLALEKGVPANFLGTMSDHRDIIKEMKETDVFVMPSIRESMGIAILETMACSTPVISTATEGPIDYIEHGKNGMLVPINDAESLAQSLIQILSANDLRKKIGKNARKTAEKYDWNFVIKKIVTEYDKMV